MSRIPVVVAAAVVTVALVGASTPAFASTGTRGTSSIYVIGDSWSSGRYADPEHTLAQDAAEDLGVSSIVDAESGTGYVTAPGGTRTYVQRAAAIPAGTRAEAVVIQGGSNDDGGDSATLLHAIAETVAEVRQRLPEATIVLLGPGPDPWPVTQAQTAVDTVLEQAAFDQDVAYISPLQEGWFTASTVGTIINPATAHPTVAGDEVLGQLLADDLRPLLTNGRSVPTPARYQQDLLLAEARRGLPPEIVGRLVASRGTHRGYVRRAFFALGMPGLRQARRLNRRVDSFSRPSRAGRDRQRRVLEGRAGPTHDTPSGLIRYGVSVRNKERSTAPETIVQWQWKV